MKVKRIAEIDRRYNEAYAKGHIAGHIEGYQRGEKAGRQQVRSAIIAGLGLEEVPIDDRIVIVRKKGEHA